MDIKELEEKYPFLDNVLKAYKEYDKQLENIDELNSFYMKDVTYADVDYKTQYKDICIKLLRNLKLLKEKEYSHGNNQEYCTYLYHWLYKETKESDISNILISTIFEDFHKIMARQQGQNICPYALYKKDLYEPRNLAKLSYINHNYDNIISILKNNDDKHYCSCQKYLKDCVDIYRVMKEPSCTNIQGNNKYNEKICHELTQFEIYYLLITRDAEIEKKTPNLYSGIWKEELSKCKSNDQAITPVTESPTHTDTSKSNISSAVISSMAGIPPFLVLIYKFTPVGKFFRFENKNTKITSNFDKEIENELFHVMQKDSNIKDIQSKYNIGYEPI
ncbi:PIR protein [Plasmodium vivax]|nr:PIR protein [Plasmodium vivax]